MIRIFIYVLSLALAANVSAQTLRSISVDPIDDDAPEMGCTLREAIELANAQQPVGLDCEAEETGSGTPFEYEILLPEMVYGITGRAREDGNQAGDFDIAVAVRIIGAGRDLTIIDGQQQDRLFQLIEGLGFLHLESLTLRNGIYRRVAAASGISGGAVHAERFTSFSALDVAFVNNVSELEAGAIFLDKATANLENCRFEGNQASFDGAAILIRSGSTLDIDNCEFLGHQGNDVINLSASPARLRRVLIADSLGTAIFSGGSNSVVLVDSTIRDNLADNGGGLVGSSFVIANTSIFGNQSRLNGGGAILSSSVLTNVSIVNNAAGTFFNGVGGGLLSNSDVQLRNTIIAGNTASLEGDDCSGSIASEGFNLIGNNGGCQDSFPSGTPNANDDLVGTPALPLDPEVTEDRLTGVVSIAETSAAIDQIPPSNCTFLSIGNNPIFNDGDPVLTDQRGVDRDALCDIGALEFFDDIVFASGFEEPLSGI